MSEAGHDLHSLFPADEQAIHALKMCSELFRALADRHHLLCQEIHRIEAGLDPASDRRLEELKKERLGVLDEIGAMVAGAKAA
jgi:uncharacterized protein YdcH (DUF465 family)